MSCTLRPIPWGPTCLGPLGVWMVNLQIHTMTWNTCGFPFRKGSTFRNLVRAFRIFRVIYWKEEHTIHRKSLLLIFFCAIWLFLWVFRGQICRLQASVYLSLWGATQEGCQRDAFAWDQPSPPHGTSGTPSNVASRLWVPFFMIYLFFSNMSLASGGPFCNQIPSESPVEGTIGRMGASSMVEPYAKSLKNQHTDAKVFPKFTTIFPHSPRVGLLFTSIATILATCFMFQNNYFYRLLAQSPSLWMNSRSVARFSHRTDVDPQIRSIR